MSKQLTLSAALSVVAMAAFALLAEPQALSAAAADAPVFADAPSPLYDQPISAPAPLGG